MTDQLLQAIEERLAQRRRAGLGTMTDERREKALRSLVQRARNNDGDGKERLEKLVKLFPQSAEWVAEQMALGPPIPEAEQMGAMSAVEWERIGVPLVSANPVNSAEPFESVRETTRRQMREAGDAPSPAITELSDSENFVITPATQTPSPEPPKPEWYTNGQHKSGLKLADQLKRLLGPRPERGDGSWMRKR
jgi:hypothetical protein